ncbi:MAG: hypothetical protein K6G37_02410 [Bacilli bacterium]|nr:hypothetical protein [Bacilli bacterium]
MKDFWIDFGVLDGHDTQGMYFAQSCKVEDGIISIIYMKIEEDGTICTMEDQYLANSRNYSKVIQQYLATMIFIFKIRNEGVFEKLDEISNDIEYYKSRITMSRFNALLGILSAPAIGYSIANFDENQFLYTMLIIVGGIAAISGMRSVLNIDKFKNQIDLLQTDMIVTMKQEYQRIKHKD